MTCAQFAGYNGFEQFGCIEIVGDKFTDFSLPCLEGVRLSPHHVSCGWDYNAIACGRKLYLSGCINGVICRSKQIEFEHDIGQVATNEKFCLVLLKIGTLFKVKLETFEVSNVNAIILDKGCPEESANKRTNIFANPARGTSTGNEEKVTHVATGRSMTVVITNENHVYNVPLRIMTFPKHIKVKKMCCGTEHCLILTTNGDIYAFGSSSRGQLGLESLNTEEQPTLLDALAGVKIVDIAAAGWHSAAVSVFGDLYAWGWNVNGQLGLKTYKEVEMKFANDKTETRRQKLPSVFPVPQLINLPMNDNYDENDANEDLDDQHDIVRVSAGVRHTIVSTRAGIMLGSGWNRYGQLGVAGTDDIDRFRPIAIDGRFSTDFEFGCGEWCTVVLRNS